MTATARTLAALGAAALLAGCVSMPSGPSVMVLPGSTKSFDQFRADDLDCRQFANLQVGGSTPDSAAADSAVKSAAVGTAVGAVAGAAIGGQSGAAAGAGMGLITGSMIGASSGGMSQYEIQRRYDYAYQQCMYARGHKIPMAGYAGRQAAPAQPAAPSRYYGTPPPPPAGTPPPPPGAR